MNPNRITVDEVIEVLVKASGHELTDYQRQFLDDHSPLRAVLKARQTGFSWIFAVEALANALVHGRFSVFISLNREEASEKIAYARDLYDALPEEYKVKLTRGSMQHLRFANGGRLSAYACRAARGLSGANVYLDEMAFYPKSDRVYTGTLPAAVRGGRITAASTPNGERGAFWNIVEGTRHADGYSQYRIPWWKCPWLIGAAEIPDNIEDLETSIRVERFATPALKRQFQAMELTSFQQEYEMRFMDDALAFIPMEEIESCVDDQTIAVPNVAALAALPGRLYAGYDVGRTRDASALVITQVHAGKKSVRYTQTLVNAPYDHQETLLTSVLALPNLRSLTVDSNGIGSMLTENLKRKNAKKVHAETFETKRKERMAVELRIAIQAGELSLPRKQQLMRDLHAVRRTGTEDGKVRFEAPRQANSHADLFWAAAMAHHATQIQPPELAIHTIR